MATIRTGNVLRHTMDDKPLKPIVVCKPARVFLAPPTLVPPPSAHPLPWNPNPWKLTDRQREIMEYMGRGLTRGEVAVALGISAKTLDIHLLRIRERMRVTTTSAAIHRWLQRLKDGSFEEVRRANEAQLIEKLQRR